MAVNTKIIKRRIKSIGSTSKITKAMEMISAVKMRRAVANVLSTRSYANLAWEMLTEIAQKTDTKHHPLLEKREVKKIAMIFITSNRGLAGGFTSRLLTDAHNYILQQEGARPLPALPLKGEAALAFPPFKEGTQGVVSVDVVLTGKRGKKIYTRFNHNVALEFDKLDLTTKIEEILPIAQIITADYIAGKYDKVVVAYTDFASAIRQVPRIKQLLPLEKQDDMLGVTASSPHGRGQGEGSLANGYGFKFEPDPAKVLNILIPRLVEMQIYQAMLESDASEHSARMMAMRNASDAARDMIKELNYTFNKARQAAITQEISEIVGGAAALG